jgi:glycosyltransferase involved in cell wall biosynthesis
MSSSNGERVKVGILSMKGNFNKDLGQGVQKYIYNIWRNLLALDSGHTIEKVELGVGNGMLMRELSFTLSTFVRSLSGYNIIHIPAPIAFNPLRRGNAAVITTAHEFILLDKDNPLAAMPETGGSFFETKIHEACIRQMLGSDHMIVDSTLVRGEAIRLGYDRDKISVVNIGVDDEFIKTPLRPRNGRKRPFVVGRLGSFWPRKNAAFTINAFMKLQDKDIRYDVWGKPSGNYDELVRMAAGDPRIAFKGFVPKDRMVRVYDSFDVYLHPALYGGFEMEILEAQARGVPVIISKRAQITKEVKRYCYEARDEDHMARIIKEIKDNGYDRQLRRRAMDYARKFTWRKTAEETLKVYERVHHGA